MRKRRAKRPRVKRREGRACANIVGPLVPKDGYVRSLNRGEAHITDRVTRRYLSIVNYQLMELEINRSRAFNREKFYAIAMNHHVHCKCTRVLLNSVLYRLLLLSKKRGTSTRWYYRTIAGSVNDRPCYYRVPHKL